MPHYLTVLAIPFFGASVQFLGRLHFRAPRRGRILQDSGEAYPDRLIENYGSRVLDLIILLI